MKKIFTPIKLGPYTLKNRIAMSALTRCRCDPNTAIPNDLHKQYYTERAENAGFILTECTAISKRGNAFPGATGIYNDEQVEGWKKVIDSVHNVNGRIFLQIWHGGRATKKAYTGFAPQAPSPLPIRTPKRGGGVLEAEMPEELTEDGMKEILDHFRNGAVNAKKAGFDGVQLHGANGYLIDTFLRDATNKRSDKYGGSIENRCRFPLMVMDALSEVFGPEKVGIKVTPLGRFQDMFDSDPVATYSYFLKELNKRKIAFVEIPKAPEFVPAPNLYGVEGEHQIPDVYKTFRPHFDGVLIANNSFTPEDAINGVEEGKFDMVTFGRLFIANPDLVNRIQNNWGFNEIRPKLFYVPGKEGYIDYPKHEQTAKI